MSTFTHNFDTPVYKAKISFPTGVFIDGKFSQGSTKKTLECVPSASPLSHPGSCSNLAQRHQPQSVSNPSSSR